MRILELISVGGVWQAGFPCFGAEQGIYQGIITGNFAIPMLAEGEGRPKGRVSRDLRDPWGFGVLPEQGMNRELTGSVVQEERLLLSPGEGQLLGCQRGEGDRVRECPRQTSALYLGGKTGQIDALAQIAVCETMLGGHVCDRGTGLEVGDPEMGFVERFDERTVRLWKGVC